MALYEVDSRQYCVYCQIKWIGVDSYLSRIAETSLLGGYNSGTAQALGQPHIDVCVARDI